MNKELIELPSEYVCPKCENHKQKNNKHICKMTCIQSEDVNELWEDCPRIDKKYRIREYE